MTAILLCNVQFNSGVAEKGGILGAVEAGFRPIQAIHGVTYKERYRVIQSMNKNLACELEIFISLISRAQGLRDFIWYEFYRELDQYLPVFVKVTG